MKRLNWKWDLCVIACSRLAVKTLADSGKHLQAGAGMNISTVQFL